MTSIPEQFVDYFRDVRSDRYVDTCVVTRYNLTSPTFNESTGKNEYPSTTPYSGACLVRPGGAAEVEYGEDIRQVGDYLLYLPHDAAILEEGDEVAVTSTLDPDIPTPLKVLRGFGDSLSTHHRYECQAVTDD